MHFYVVNSELLYYDISAVCFFLGFVVISTVSEHLLKNTAAKVGIFWAFWDVLCSSAATILVPDSWFVHVWIHSVSCIYNTNGHSFCFALNTDEEWLCQILFFLVFGKKIYHIVQNAYFRQIFLEFEWYIYIFRCGMNSTFTWAMTNKSI